MQARLCFQQWRDRGYQVAVLAEDLGALHQLDVDLVVQNEVYPGYAASINRLTKAVLAADPECQVVVAMADDIFPDTMRHPEDIATLFVEHFGGTLGVMQPIADPWSIDGIAPQATKVAGSPWLGRDWCRRAFGGRGPLPDCYHHMFCDQHLQEVAIKLGLFWQNPDVAQIHQHWMRLGNSMPEHIMHAHEAWNADEAMFLKMRQEGFPGHELLTDVAGH